MRALLDLHSGARRWLRAWGVSFLVWTVLWAYLVWPTFLWFRERGEPIRWWPLGAYLGDHWVSAVLTPVFLALAWRYPLDRGSRRHSLPRLIGLIVLFAALDDALCIAQRYGLFQWSGAERILAMVSSSAELTALYVRTAFNYAQIAAVGWAIHYQKEARVREVRASQLEASLARARLDALRMRIHPHFLFNTLNSIATLMHRDLDAAERMIARLSDLLRYSLAGSGAQEVTLKEELELSERYIDIERIRFADRLTVRSSVDPDTLEALVPNLVLQPLVENAIRHGVAARAAGGQVELVARREGADLVVSVLDDGPGIDPDRAAPGRCGVGLGSTRDRLAELYRGAAHLEIRRRAQGGTEVSLRIPYRMAPVVPGSEVELLGQAGDELAGTEAAPATYSG